MLLCSLNMNTNMNMVTIRSPNLRLSEVQQQGGVCTKNRTLQSPTSVQELTTNLPPQNPRLRGISASSSQLMPENDSISFTQSICTVGTLGGKSELAVNSGKTLTVCLGSKRRSLTRYLPHIKVDWNAPSFLDSSCVAHIVDL